MGDLVLVTAPVGEPLALPEAKLFAKIDVTEDDALVTDLIAAARRRAEQRHDRAYLTQTFDLFLDRFPVDEAGRDAPIVCPRPPLQSVTSLSYVQSDGTTVVVASTDYTVDVGDRFRHAGQLVPAYGKTWPSVLLKAANGVIVR